MSTPKFNSPKSAKLWQELVEDLLLSSDKTQSTDIETLKQRYGKLEVTLKVAPSVLLTSEFRKMAADLDRQFKELEEDVESVKKLPLAQDTRAALKEELDRFEQNLFASLKRQQNRAVGTPQRKKTPPSPLDTRNALQRRANEVKSVAESVVQQLADSTEGTENSTTLEALKKQLAGAISSFKQESAALQRASARQDEISDSLEDLEVSVGRRNTVSSATSNSWFRRLQAMTQRSPMGTVGRRSLFQGLYSNSKRDRQTSSKVVRKNTASSASVQDREDAENREEMSLLRRQVSALERLTKLGGGSSGSSFAGGGGIGAPKGRLAKLLAAAGKFGLLGLAGLSGWAIGSWIYEKYSEEIQDGIEVVVGLVEKTVEWVSKGVEWFTDFLKSPMSYIKAIGGKLKAAWDKSIFAKFWNSPGTVLKEAATNIVAKLNQTEATIAPTVSSAKAVSKAAGAPSTGNTLSTTQQLYKTAGSHVNMSGLNPGVQSSFSGMLSEYRAKGGGVTTVTSGFRSTAEQARLYAKDPTKAAPPGRSAHEKGLAIDVSSSDANKMSSMGLLSKYGFARPVKNEPWHLQATGTSTPLAAAGVYIADYPSDQGANSSPVPLSVDSALQSVSNDFSQLTTPMSIQSAHPTQPTTFGDVTKGSVSSIPTFSYMDSGFFLMNVGVLAGS